MINKIKVTIDNAASFIGAKVELDFGAYHPTEYAVVERFEIVPANRWEDAHVKLIARKIESGAEQDIKEFSDKGIGCRLVEMPVEKEVEAPKKKSPWAV